MSGSRRRRDADQPEGDAGERGAALVLVLTFGVGILGMVGLLLTLTQVGTKSQADFHRLKNMSLLLRVGISQAVFELNQAALDDNYTAPAGREPGFILVDESDGGAGRVVADGDGRRLGRFMTTVADVGDGVYEITVRAAYPDFVKPQQLVAAKTQVETGKFNLPGDRNPFSINGTPETVSDNKFMDKVEKANVTIIDPTATYSAVNASDPDVQQALIDSLVGEATIEGADPSNPGSPAYDADTITNQDEGLLSKSTLAALQDSISQYVAEASADPSSIRLESTYTTDTTLPNGVYILTDDFDQKKDTVFKGSGTLIIPEGAKIAKDTTFEWDGDVIVWGEDSGLHIQKDATFNVTGNVIVDSQGSDSKIRFKKDTSTTIDGALMILAQDGDVKFKLDKISGGGDTGTNEPAFTVNGIVSILSGDKVKIDFKKDVDVAVNGSFVVGLAPGAKEFEMKFSKDANIAFTFDNDNFESAIDGLNTFIDRIPPTPLPLQAKAFWDTTPPQAEADQRLAVQALSADVTVPSVLK